MQEFDINNFIYVSMIVFGIFGALEIGLRKRQVLKYIIYSIICFLNIFACYFLEEPISACVSFLLCCMFLNFAAEEQKKALLHKISLWKKDNDGR